MPLPDLSSLFGSALEDLTSFDDFVSLDGGFVATSTGAVCFLPLVGCLFRLVLPVGGLSDLFAGTLVALLLSDREAEDLGTLLLLMLSLTTTVHKVQTKSNQNEQITLPTVLRRPSC